MTKYIRKPEIIEGALWDGSLEGVGEIRELVKSIGWSIKETHFHYNGDDVLIPGMSYIRITEDADRYNILSIKPGVWVVLEGNTPEVDGRYQGDYDEYSFVKDKTLWEWELDNS